MKCIGIIPARYASTRFPGKPLVLINGMSMIERVYRQCLLSDSLSEVIVATDDHRIFDHVRQFGGKVMMTSAQHGSGTERCAEVLEIFTGTGKENLPDIVVNIQGDEPFIHPGQIDTVAACFKDNTIGIATLASIIIESSDLFNPNVVKLLPGQNNRALYFSRSVIPYLRGIPQEQWITHYSYLKHIGIYAYKAEVLQQIVKLPFSPLEKAESLEQLRWLENNYSIGFALTTLESIAIDSPEDLSKVMNII